MGDEGRDYMALLNASVDVLPTIGREGLPAPLPDLGDAPGAEGATAQLRRESTFLVRTEALVVRLARRTFDLIAASTALVLLSPVLAGVALAVYLESPGPVIFRQTRVGRFGKRFTLYKFRGMYVDARERWPELYEYDYDDDQVAELRFHPKEDPRVTRVGRFLRRTSIDEIPNFVNVLQGHMSIVGPRPEIPEMLEYYGEYLPLILSVKPGVTSLPKVTGRDGHTFLQTLMLDAFYVQHRSLLLDLKIMCKTFKTVLLQHGVDPG